MNKKDIQKEIERLENNNKRILDDDLNNQFEKIKLIVMINYELIKHYKSLLNENGKK